MSATLEQYRRSRVLVTGATGYLGSAVVARLRRLDADVIAAPRDVFVRPDTAPQVAACDIVFHLASNTSVPAAEADPEASLRSTVGAVSHLAALAERLGRCPRVVFTSTATVYGVTDGGVDEEAPPAPSTIYDEHKWHAERALMAATRDGRLDAITLRLANVYGHGPAVERSADRGFLNRAIREAKAGTDLVVYGDGRYRRDFVHLDDVVEALLLAGVAAAPASRCYNVGTGIGTPVRDALELVARTAKDVCGRTVRVRSVEWPGSARPIDRRSYAARIERIARELGWTPGVALDAGIRRTLEAGAVPCV